MPPNTQQLNQLQQQGIALLQAGRLGEAGDVVAKMLDLDRRNPFALKMAGHIACAMSQFEVAMPWLKKAIAANPKDPQPCCDLGSAYIAGGRFSEAMAAYEKALKVKPGHPQAVAGLADVLERRGRLDRAAELLAPFLAGDRATPRMAVLGAVIAQRRGDDDAALALAEKHLARPDMRDVDRQWMQYVVGDARDRQGDANGAFAAYETANTLMRQPYDPAATERDADALIDVFSAEALAGMPRARDAGETAVFIIGMPRSGTTLIEQIIHAHPQAHGAGELADLPQIAHDLPGLVGSKEGFPRCMPLVRGEHIEACAKKYRETLRRAGRRAVRVVDKNLGNHWRLGLAVLMCPGARIIHLERDPMDVCFSCYIRKLLPQLHPYASDLAHLGAYYRQFHRIMEHWHRVLDRSILRLRYEDVVAEPEAESRRIIDFLGLEWNDACLRFHEARRDVATMSYDQVRQPMYTSAVARYRRYEAHLGPLRAALGELAGA